MFLVSAYSCSTKGRKLPHTARQLQIYARGWVDRRGKIHASIRAIHHRSFCTHAHAENSKDNNGTYQSNDNCVYIFQVCVMTNSSGDNIVWG